MGSARVDSAVQRAARAGVETSGHDSSLSADGQADRRRYFRRDLRVPLTFRDAAAPNARGCYAVTRNISAGGVLFESDGPAPEAGSRVHVEFTLPAGEGVWPTDGLGSSVGEIIRVSRISGSGDGRADRFSVAARFVDSLRLDY